MKHDKDPGAAADYARVFMMVHLLEPLSVDT